MKPTYVSPPTKGLPMLAFHNDAAVKKKYVARVAAHRRADELERGATGQNGRGCAVWCTLDAYDHSRYPVELGIPLELAHLEDRLFENMPIARAMMWPAEFLRAITVGADLSDVWPKFAIWLLKDIQKYARPDGKKAIDAVVGLYRERAKRDDPTWKEARRAAVAAAYAAYAAAAAYAAYAAAAAAAAAAYAAYAVASDAAAAAAAAYADAADAADAAAYAAAYAAAAAVASDGARQASRQEHFCRQSRKLLDLLRHAKAPKRVAA
jgi:hypothetical protein